MNYLNWREIDGYGCPVNIIETNRGYGKSYGWKKKCVKMAVLICMQKLIIHKEQLPICGLLTKYKNLLRKFIIMKKKNYEEQFQ